jgi:hypothetical protein
MELTIYMVALSCTCLIVGIYFFFVRPRPGEKPQDSQ